MKNFKVTLIHFENHVSDPDDREASAGRARSIHRSQNKMVMFIHLVLHASGAEAAQPAVSEGWTDLADGL